MKKTFFVIALSFLSAENIRTLFPLVAHIQAREITERKNFNIADIDTNINELTYSTTIPVAIKWVIKNQDNYGIIDSIPGDINEQNIHGDTALMVAVFLQQYRLVHILLRKGANPNIKNQHGFTALIFASFFNKKNIIDLLLECNADVNAQTNNGVTALFAAVAGNNVEAVESLLKCNNINPNTTNIDGINALYLAYQCHRLPIIKLLLKHPNINLNLKIKPYEKTPASSIMELHNRRLSTLDDESKKIKEIDTLFKERESHQ